MAALPYIQLYPADYLADTAHLNAAQHGAYLLLIMNYWQTGAPLKDSNVRLANVARMSQQEWIETREMLEEFFEIKDGEWIHHRIERDLSGVYSKSKNASMAGKASAEARRIKRLTNVATNVQRNVNHTDTDTDTDVDKDQKHLSPEKKKTKRDKPQFELPSWIDVSAWDGFIEMRKSIKKPLTDSGKKLAIDKLQKLGREGHSPTDVLNQSTLSSWQGLFAVKEEFRNGQRTETSRKLSAVELVAARGAERERARQGAQPQYFEQGDFIEGECTSSR